MDTHQNIPVEYQIAFNNAKNKRDYERIIKKAAKESIDIAEYLVKTKNFRMSLWFFVLTLYPHALDIRGPFGTILHSAIYDFDIESIKKLISMGANVNARGNCDQTPLMVTLYSGNNGLTIAKILLENGANPYLTDNGGVSYAKQFKFDSKKGRFSGQNPLVTQIEQLINNFEA